MEKRIWCLTDKDLKEIIKTANFSAVLLFLKASKKWINQMFLLF